MSRPARITPRCARAWPRWRRSSSSRPLRRSPARRTRRTIPSRSSGVTGRSTSPRRRRSAGEGSPGAPTPRGELRRRARGPAPRDRAARGRGRRKRADALRPGRSRARGEVPLIRTGPASRSGRSPSSRADGLARPRPRRGRRDGVPADLASAERRAVDDLRRGWLPDPRGGGRGGQLVRRVAAAAQLRPGRRRRRALPETDSATTLAGTDGFSVGLTADLSERHHTCWPRSERAAARRTFTRTSAG